MRNFKGLKKAIAGLTMAAMCVSAIPFSMSNSVVEVQAATTSRQMESLSRGLVAVKTNSGVFLSWRLLGTESYSTKFNVYRDGVKIASNISDSTNYLDTNGTSSSTYVVRSVVSGSEVDQSDAVTPWSNNYKDVPLNKPADTTLDGETVTYAANDATVADVDGDGEYEIILKWDPSNSKDNSQSGYTSNVYVDCYEMDGTMRWRIDLGKNIRAGAHYTQFIAYDLNGDGKAEVAMKTADGTVDGQGNVIGDSSADYRNSSGYILSGPEYLTLFEGKTGKALYTTDYYPERGTVSSWGDSYGNRVDRFLAGVAYFDGKTPSLVMCRGYYTRAVIVSYEYKGGKLNQEWVFDTSSSGNSSYEGQGNHSLSIADVDGDGKDEVIYGSAVIDNDGTGLYTTGQGHGDALHVGDFDPDRDGLEVYQVHETKTSSIESVQMRDAESGKTIWSHKLSADVGRGLIVNIGPDYYPYIALSSKGAYDSEGNQVTTAVTNFGINFASYWDGDLYREVLDKTYINKWDWENQKVVRVLTGSDVHYNNSTKANPSLSGDILGDWREEVMWPTTDDTALRIYTTTDVTDAKLYTLMHDSQYRTAIAWQNVGYNQPPHTSYYIGPEMDTPSQPSIYTVGSYSLPGVSDIEEETTTEKETTESSGSVASSAEWVFGDSSFKDLGTISSTVTVDNLTLVATSAKTMSVNSDSQTVNGTTYKYALALGGGGSTSYRAVKVPVSGDDTINVVLRSSGTTTRTLVVADESGNQLGTMSAASTASMGTYNYAGDAGYVYLYSSGSGINLYMIQVDSKSASVEQESTSTIVTSYSTLSEGWYYIKNVNSQKYLQVADNSGFDGANVEQGTGTGVTGQRWYLTNTSNGYFTLKNGTGYMLDIPNGENADGTNVQVWSANGLAPQEFKLVKSSVSGSYGILTSASADTKALDVYGFSTEDGGNVCQWTYYDNSCQQWVFEAISEETESETETKTEETTEAASGTSYVHNFTTDGTSSSFLTFSSKKNISSDKGSYTYNGTKLTTCLKVESSTTVSFTTTKANAKLIMVVQSKSSSGALKISGPSSTTISGLTSTVELREITLGAAGTYTISKSSGENYIYYIEVVE